MGKHEKGTPKEMANRVKSKGMQKLKWFCQMCSKQCRDQNGFKCHLNSESHQRQLLLFAENQNSYLREFSQDFEGNFMHILRHTYGSKRVRANEVYQEYIRDKGHVHMNATVWHTLSGFVQYLGSSGKCKIDLNEKGWHIQYIDQEEEIRKKKLVEKVKQEKDDEDRMNELLQPQKNEEAKAVDDKSQVVKELKREEGEVVKFALSTTSKIIKKEAEDSKEGIPKIFPKKNPNKTASHSSKKTATTVKRSALEELRDEEEDIKDKRKRKDYWIHEGIIVMTKQFGSENYKYKGPIVELVDKYTAKVELLGVKVHQDDLETVIPAIGKDMLIVNGAYRGEKAVLLELLEDRFMLRLKIKQGTRNGRTVEVNYEDASKCS